MPTRYLIEETKCYPNKFKIVPVGNWRENNSSTEYFKTRAAAIIEIERRGASVEYSRSHVLSQRR